MKSYTDIEQSRKLAEILPFESADMYWFRDDTETPKIYPKDMMKDSVSVTLPCWSLAALLEQLPYEVCDDGGNSSYLEINKGDDVYQLVYEDPYGDFESIETDRYEHFVDACYELILKLHEQKLI